MTFILPKLSYPYNEFEPFIDKETMEIHYTKHHQTYINNANLILNDLKVFNNLTIEALIKQIKFIPSEKQIPLRNNAGGHINHSLFWNFLKKNSVLEGTLKKAIENNFHSIESFKEKFEICATNRFGSGWIWLVKKHDNTLDIISTANQDNPLMGKDISGVEYSYPLLGLDVWEHAYYLKYQNKRLDYVKSFWNIVNWEEASKRFNHLF